MTRQASRARFPRWRAAVAAVITLGTAAAYAAFWDAPLVEAIEGQTVNWRFQLRGPLTPPPEIVVIAIDDRTVDGLQRWPLPRGALAEAVATLDAAGAAVIGLDLLLLDREQASDGIALAPGDRHLREALQATDQAVLGLAFTFGPAGPADEEVLSAVREAAFRVVHRDGGIALAPDRQATGALIPIAPFRDAAGLGHVNVLADQDGALRHLFLAVPFADRYVPAFSVEIARRFLGLGRDETVLMVGRGLRLGQREIAADPLLRLAINYYGAAGTVRTYAMIDLLDGRVPAESLAGRAVLIGATALGAGDSFVTPFSRTLPGVEALATVVGNLVDGQALARTATSMGWDLAAILFLGLAAFACAHLPSPVLAVVATLAVLAGWASVAQLAFQQSQLWLDMTFPTTVILLNGGFVAVSRTVAERRLRRDAERQRRNLSRYHSPMIADLLAESETLSFDQREQHAAILFVDIAGFTGRSEQMAPAETVHFLRDFHRLIERAVLAHGGVVEQFMGDGAMVIFGVPTPSDQDAVAALACARHLVGTVRRWTEELTRAGRAPLRIGIGVHYGPVVIARLGGDTQRQLTAAGDTVNVASRLEALTRHHDAAIALSAAAAAAVRSAGREDLLAGFTELPAQPIRGREERIPVWVAQAHAMAGSSV
ncbi:adenylate/guanylate cyclase domain-containing protein [Rhodospirillaceae bacterium SYSU D60014]|uniref:CHASE2 domain-containing protein n=1 Tax=Virgifigura deserti TaxID=2268457 RepID=UPI000E66656F